MWPVLIFENVSDGNFESDITRFHASKDQETVQELLEYEKPLIDNAAKIMTVVAVDNEIPGVHHYTYSEIVNKVLRNLLQKKQTLVTVRMMM